MGDIQDQAPTRGRAGRKARRAATATASGPAYITRKIPTYELLGEDGLAKLEDNAETILQEVGFEVREDEHAQRLFREAGADVKGERVRFPRGMLQAIIQRTAPACFTQHARNPARNVEIGHPHTVFSPAYGSPFVQDMEGGRRYGTMADFENFVKLAYASPWLHHSGGTICEPVDIPVNKRHLDMIYAHMRWSDKGFMGSVTAGERAEDSIEMCRILFGADFVDENCVIMGNINMNSPLTCDLTMTAALRAYASANQCAVVVPFILGGAMGPVTTAGAIAQAHAEAMVGVALTQLVRPGAPVVYGNFLSSMSLKSGAPTFGMPEPALAYLAVGQLARRLGVPLRCGGALTAAKVPDYQAGQESADSLMPALLCGAKMHVFMGGLALDDNAFALDAFRENGPGQHFFDCAHTMANYETAFFEPLLSDNTPFEHWEEQGSRDARTRAHGAWKQALADYEAPPLDEGVDEALREYVTRKKSAVADKWY
jgi:trimethylamine--corrinoid protein Co-methyltransferase